MKTRDGSVSITRGDRKVKWTCSYHLSRAYLHWEVNFFNNQVFLSLNSSCYHPQSIIVFISVQFIRFAIHLPTMAEIFIVKRFLNSPEGMTDKSFVGWEILDNWIMNDDQMQTVTDFSCLSFSRRRMELSIRIAQQEENGDHESSAFGYPRVAPETRPTRLRRQLQEVSRRGRSNKIKWKWY